MVNEADRKRFVDGYGNVYGSMVSTPVGRILFPNIAKPSPKYNKYSLTLVFDKKEPKTQVGLDVMTREVPYLLMQKFKNAEAIKSIKRPSYMDGDSDDALGADGTRPMGFAGHWFIRANSSKPVEVIELGDKGKVILDPSVLLSGMLVRAVVVPMAYSDGVTYQLKHVQMVKDDGVRFYGGPDPVSLLMAADMSDIKEDTKSALDTI